MGCNSPGEVLHDFDGDGSLDADDCDPGDGTIHPGAPDSFGDGIDLDGDGAPAEGFDTPAEMVDCDDFDETIHPGADEECGRKRTNCKLV
jgi:hypothetical protein